MEVIQGEAEIEFPCEWNYKIIGEDEKAIRTAVFDTVPKEYTLKDSKTSSGGKYRSFKLTVTVESREEMVGIFNKLKYNNAIKMVI